MATTIKLTNKFADNSTRDMTIGTLDDSAMTYNQIAEKIKLINANVAEIENLYLSKDGAKFVEISAAQVIVDNTTEINLS